MHSAVWLRPASSSQSGQCVVQRRDLIRNARRANGRSGRNRAVSYGVSARITGEGGSDRAERPWVRDPERSGLPNQRLKTAADALVRITLYPDTGLGIPPTLAAY